MHGFAMDGIVPMVLCEKILEVGFRILDIADLVIVVDEVSESSLEE